MFVDEINIHAKAGNGGGGVVRWRHDRQKPLAGPGGGNGGRGGDVYIRGVKDLGLLAKYRGAKTFEAKNGLSGDNYGKFGKDGKDLYISVPVGATVTNLSNGREHTAYEVGEEEKILIGGKGGLGNEYFKSSTNRTPKQSTEGSEGEAAGFKIDLALLVDVGLIGLPNAGKSTLLNTLTNASADVGSYPFTTLEPHLGALYEFVIADIPGLIEGASAGKGLGHKFLKHVEKTKMLLHLVSLENEDPLAIYETIREELGAHSGSLLEKEEWIVLTKTDLVSSDVITSAMEAFSRFERPLFTISSKEGEGIKELQDALTQNLRKKVPSE